MALNNRKNSANTEDKQVNTDKMIIEMLIDNSATREIFIDILINIGISPRKILSSMFE